MPRPANAESTNTNDAELMQRSERLYLALRCGGAQSSGGGRNTGGAKACVGAKVRPQVVKRTSAWQGTL